MPIFTVWQSKDRMQISLVGGEEPPPQDDCVELLWRIEAATSEEASAIHHLRLGWEPYKPIGEAAPCPKCGAMFYPEGSGECWRCGPIC